MSRVIGIACRRSSEWSAACRLRHVETSPCDHCCPGRPVPVRGRPHLRGFSGLDQPAHGPLPGRGPGRVRAALPGPEVEPGGDPAGHGRAGAAAAQATRRAGLDAGADTIGWHLAHHHATTLSRATINRILVRAGVVTPEPSKRPKSSYIRFEAEQPNECWQSDFTHYRLTRPDGSPGADTEILTWLDDCSRYALPVTAHVRVTGPIVLATFRETVARHGIPASTLTDNGMVFTTRFSGGKGGRNHLETRATPSCHITQKNGQPNHPQTHGKVERFQQTLKNWLRAQPAQPATIDRAAGPARRVRRAVQPPPTAPLPAPPRHPGDDLHHAAQGHPDQRPQHRHPRPRPPRQDRQSRQRHPARRRPTPPHRRRPNPRPNRRHPARPRPARPHHQRRHRPDSCAT